MAGIFIMMPTFVSNAQEVVEQQELGRGDKAKIMFYVSLQATIKERKQSRK
jgi:hypothetical protein